MVPSRYNINEKALTTEGIPDILVLRRGLPIKDTLNSSDFLAYAITSSQVGSATSAFFTFSPEEGRLPANNCSAR